MNGRRRRIAVVGASLAGLRAAETLRRLGHDGKLVIIGDEPQLPYDRPPLSKQLLSGERTPDQVRLPIPADLKAHWELGSAAVSLDLGARLVNLTDGRTVGFDGLVLATGARAREWADQQGAAHLPSGVVTLRGIDDARLLADMWSRAERLVVVGAGFLGGEVASTARKLGLSVTLVESQPLPLLAATGAEVGAFVAELHREAAVELLLNVGVRRFAATATGALRGVELTDGRHIRANCAVLALGARPNAEWLVSSGLTVNRGLVCDAALRPVLLDGGAAPDVVAAGDLVRWPHPLADGQLLGLGHWTNAAEQGETAARTLLSPDHPTPFQPVPSFWSDLHGVQIRSTGLPQLADTAEVVEKELPSRRLVVTYQRDGRLIGALAINRTSRLAGYRQQILDRISIPARGTAHMRTLAAIKTAAPSGGPSR